MEQKKYLVCIDSDGCAIDSMNIKHFQCFGPAYITIWKLEQYSEPLLKRWNDINLFTPTRGINRFKGLAMILSEFPVTDSSEDIMEFVSWTNTTGELSNTALQECCHNGPYSGNPVFSKALSWSLLVNEMIEKLPVSQPFMHVRECIAQIKDLADIAVVSSANKEAILIEWNQGGLSEYVNYFFSQSDGSKSQCIHKMILKGYQPDHILMVGDAPGDAKAADDANVWFYPILAGKETESWKHLSDYEFKRFLSNEFTVHFQQELLALMKENLQ